MGNGDRRHPRRDADAFDGADELAEYDERYEDDAPPGRRASGRRRSRARPHDDYAGDDWERSATSDDAWAGDDADDDELASRQQSALVPLPARDLVPQPEGRDGALPAPFTAQDTGPFIIPGSGESMGLGFIPRRERPLAMRLAVIALVACVLFTGLFAVVPQSAGSVEAQSGSPFQALAGAVVWHAQTGYLLYTARAQDTVESIAAKFNCQIGGIYELNNMLSGEEIQIGKTYKIPTDPNYGLYYRPPSYYVSGASCSNCQRFGNSPWDSVAGLGIPDGSPCAPYTGTDMSYQLYGPNPNSTWVRGFSWYHNGVDISQPAGAKIHAAQAGQVIFAGWDVGGGGWAVKIDNCNHLSTFYAHMLQPAFVKAGDFVTAGQVIGLEGSTGWSTGPHLHFTVEVDNNPVDPLPYFNYDISGYHGITRCGAAASC
jgi:LysM repeat protein